MNDNAWKQLLNDIEHDEPTVEEVLELTRDALPDVRLGAYLTIKDRSLHRHHDIAEQMFLCLINGQLDEVEDIRHASAALLEDSGTLYWDRTIQLLTQHDSRWRLAAARALFFLDVAAQSVQGASVALLERIQDPSESQDVREAASHALVNIASLSPLPAQVAQQVASFIKMPNTEIRQAAEYLLPRLQTTDCIGMSRFVEIMFRQNMTTKEAAHLTNCLYCRRILEREKEIIHPSDSQLAASTLDEETLRHLNAARCERCRIRRESLTTVVDVPANTFRTLMTKLVTYSEKVLFGFAALILDWRRWIIPASVALNIVLIPAMMFFWGRLSEREAVLRGVVQSAIDQSLSDVAQVMMLKNTGSTSGLDETVRQMRVIPAMSHGEIYPYPVLSPTGVDPTRLADGLRQYPELKLRYDEVLTKWSAVFNDMGDLLVERGKVQEALQIFEYLKARSKSFDPGLSYALAELNKVLGQHEKAISIYREMIRESNDDPRPWNFAGFSFFKLKRYDEALQNYQMALEAFQRIASRDKGPGDPPYSNYAKVYINIALVYREMPGLSAFERDRQFKANLDKAMQLTMDAYGREGENNPRVTFTLAILHAYLADHPSSAQWENCLNYLERAIRKASIYIVRAENENAFEELRKLDHPYHKRFSELLERYRPASETGFGPRLEAKFNPRRFSE